jgi:peptidyl-prolyl cis-trans isomerase C
LTGLVVRGKSCAVNRRFVALASACVLLSAIGASVLAQAPRSPDEERRARVLARIGDVTVTVGAVEDELNRLSPFVRARYRDPARLREYVDNLVELELLAREGERRGFGSDAEVRRSTLENAVQHMIRTEIDERITADSIPEADVLVYYDAHPEEFSRPEMRRASHVLVATRDEATALVEELRAADMRAFRALALSRSLDTESNQRGGDLRYFDTAGRGPNAADPAVHAAIATAAFGLAAVGDVSEPVEVDGRFSIVKLTGIRPAEHRSAAEASDAIRMRLFRQRREEALDRLVEELRARIPTEVHPERMANLRMEAPERSSADPDEHGEAADEVEETSGEGLPSLDPLRPEPEAPALPPE